MRAVGINTADRDYFQAHKSIDSGTLEISKPVSLRVDGATAVQLTRRLNKPDGTFAGIVLLSVHPDFFTHFYTQPALGEQRNREAFPYGQTCPKTLRNG
jgi:hypothetical protein